MTLDDDGLCHNDPNPDDWFADAGNHEARARAMRVCQACPVRVECLNVAIARRFPGIWGATSEAQRDRMARA